MEEFLAKFRLWRREAKRWFHGTIFSDVGSIYDPGKDPRELPRPSRTIPAANWSNYQEQKTNYPFEQFDFCGCDNCLRLEESMTECFLCLEPLQGARVFSCYCCGNNLCSWCAQQLNRCPFCRANIPPGYHMNLSLERLLSTLSLPCRNARWGCQKRLQLSNRIAHEQNCVFGPVGCPWQAGCGWKGKENELHVHLRDSHGVAILSGNSIKFHITNFRSRILNSHASHVRYVATMAHYGAIFMCEICVRKKKLQVLLKQMQCRTKRLNFKATFTMVSSCLSLKSIMPVSHHNEETKHVNIPCKKFISNMPIVDEEVIIDIKIQPTSHE